MSFSVYCVGLSMFASLTLPSSVDNLIFNHCPMSDEVNPMSDNAKLVLYDEPK